MREKLKEAWLDLRGHSVAEVIRRLNPIIRGQANYYRIGDASKTFHDLDHWMFEREVRYVKNTHPTKNWSWRKARYWGTFYPERNDHWVFGDKRTGIALLKFSWLRIQRHTLVRGTASPDDPALAEYWRERERGKVRTLPTQKRRIAQRQGCMCPACGQSLFNGEDLQIHHLVPRRDGGRDDEMNLALRHLYCHQQLHRHGDV
jgi:RNA-directed DNA polymerase